MSQQQPYLLALLPSDILLHLSQFYLDDRDAMSSLARCDHLHNRILMNGYNRKTQIHYYPICDDSSHTDTHRHHTLSIYDIAPSHPSFRLASSPILTMVIPREYHNGNKEEEQGYTHKQTTDTDLVHLDDTIIAELCHHSSDLKIDAAATATASSSHLEGTHTITISNERRIGRLTRLTIERIWTLGQVKQSYTHSTLDQNENGVVNGMDKEQYIYVWEEEGEKQNEVATEEKKEVTLDDNTKERKKGKPTEIRLDDNLSKETSSASDSNSRWLPRTLESLCIHEYNSILSLLPPSTAFSHLHRLHTIEFIDESPFYLVNQQSLIIYPSNLHTFIHPTPYYLRSKTIIPIQSNFTFPCTITDLTIGRQYFNEEKYRVQPNLIPLPSGLIKFHFCGMTTHALDKWTNLPSTLTELRFGNYFTGGDEANFTRWNIPSQLQSLQFGQRFTANLTGIKLPDGLTRLIMSSRYTQSLFDIRLPHSLRVFEFTPDNWITDENGNYQDLEIFAAPLPDFRSTQIEQLDLSHVSIMLNPIGEYLRIPKTVRSLLVSNFPLDQFLADLEITPSSPELPQLTHLTFGEYFNQPVDELMRRLTFCSLTYLHLGKSQLIDTSISLPPTLKHLHFHGENTFVSLKGLKLPSGLETFDLGRPDSSRYRDDYPDLSHTRVTVVSTPQQWNRSLANLLLPVTLTHLQFGASFDQSISEFILPSSLRILQLNGRNFTGKRGGDGGGWFKHPLPSTLTQLDLSNKFAVPIADLSNTSIKSLALPTKWNASIDQLKLPLTLESLQFGHDFNQSISSLIFPDTLTSLMLASKFNDPGFASIRLPTSLRKLAFHDHKQEYNHALPSLAHLHQLESLILPDKWNRPLHELNLHRVNEQTPNASLTLLQFGEEFNQPIVDFQFPSSLRTLRFESQFNQPVAGTRLPSSITELRFGSSFSQPLSELVLPRQLYVLTLGHSYNASFLGVRLPPRLMQLTVGKSRRGETMSSQFTEWESLMSMLQRTPRSLQLLSLPSVADNVTLQSNEVLRLKYEEFVRKLRQVGIYAQS